MEAWRSLSWCSRVYVVIARSVLVSSIAVLWGYERKCYRFLCEEWSRTYSKLNETASCGMPDSLSLKLRDGRASVLSGLKCSRLITVSTKKAKLLGWLAKKFRSASTERTMFSIIRVRSVTVVTVTVTISTLAFTAVNSCSLNCVTASKICEICVHVKHMRTSYIIDWPLHQSGGYAISSILPGNGRDDRAWYSEPDDCTDQNFMTTNNQKFFSKPGIRHWSPTPEETISIWCLLQQASLQQCELTKPNINTPGIVLKSRQTWGILLGRFPARLRAECPERTTGSSSYQEYRSIFQQMYTIPRIQIRTRGRIHPWVHRTMGQQTEKR